MTTTTHGIQADGIDLATRRRAEILYGAIRVISREGAVAAKLKDIARESSVSLGLVQHYFDTRQKLVNEAFGAMMLVVSNEASKCISTQDDPLSYIYEIIRLHVFGTVAFPERWGFWTELWSASRHSEHLRDVATKIYSSWAHPLTAALRRLGKEGKLPPGAESERLTTGILALMDGLAIRTITEPDDFTEDQMLKILNDWVTLQLGADLGEVSDILDRLSRESSASKPTALTPETVAVALADKHNTVRFGRS